MDWQTLGCNKNPFETDPINLETLKLFVGHKEQIKRCNNLFDESNINIIVEGARGVGTTSFANYLRFKSQIKKNYLTPRCEIRIEQNWTLETLLSAVIINIVRELEMMHPDKIKKNEIFLKAKALSNRMSEAFNSFGISVFGIGGSYSQNKTITQPSLISSVALGHHIEDLANLVVKLGYKNGILIQFNNLDIGIVHEEKYLLYLFNSVRDYLQIKNTSWIFVGDIGIRSFVASRVDRLDDIISHEENIMPLNKKDFLSLVDVRMQYFSTNSKNKKYIMPLDNEVLEYLYEVTEGRLRYIFNLISKLLRNIYFGGVTDKIGLHLAEEHIKNFARDRIKNHQLTTSEEAILNEIVNSKKITVNNLSQKVSRSLPYTSKCLKKLLKSNLVFFEKQGSTKIYAPSLDAKIAYSSK
ncbi:MAG: MarR family transcriptional regulator [Bacteroidetes bacterium]|nr:MarR family transcriptional regulator [Bacteroidota bacterium]